MLDPVSITVSVLSLLLTFNNPDAKIQQTPEYQKCFSHRVERFGERITPQAVAAIDRICVTFTRYELDRRKRDDRLESSR
jgi:hypothetical protein